MKEQLNLQEQLNQRLEDLKTEYTSGQKALAGLEARQSNIQSTLLRIQGAIQVLEELAKEDSARADDTPSHVQPNSSSTDSTVTAAANDFVPLTERLRQRLQDLKGEYASGQTVLAQLEAKRAHTRDMMLCIEGAIKVLEEELAEAADMPTDVHVCEKRPNLSEANESSPVQATASSPIRPVANGRVDQAAAIAH